MAAIASAGNPCPGMPGWDDLRRQAQAAITEVTEAVTRYCREGGEAGPGPAAMAALAVSVLMNLSDMAQGEIDRCQRFDEHVAAFLEGEASARAQVPAPRRRGNLRAV